jgi:TetR/AcrR family transcriptional regulator, repressor for neighboring sulfatase
MRLVKLPAKTDEPRPRRRKRHGDEARSEGLTAARALLLEDGPAAVTLANVGKRIGMSHANVLHHFGSAAGLQSALMGSMIRDLNVALEDAVDHMRSDAGAPRGLVDQVFDAFGKGGAGQLAAWIALSRDFEHLAPVSEAVQSLVAALQEKFADAEDHDVHVRAAVLLVAICAFGDAVIGSQLRAILGQPDQEMRDLTAKLLPLFIMKQL